MASYSAMSGIDISGPNKMSARANCPDMDDGADAVGIAPAS
jgi:hypothetical protein